MGDLVVMRNVDVTPGVNKKLIPNFGKRYKSVDTHKLLMGR